MTGIDYDDETKMILDLLQEHKSMYVQDLVRYIGKNKRATIYRRLAALEGVVEKDYVNGRARYFLKQNRARVGKIDRTPSEVDRFLLRECERMVSDIISSGLLQPSLDEITESNNKDIEECRRKAEAKGESYPIEPEVLTQEALSANAKRREARLLLLRRCDSLHQALRLFAQRREVTIPGWWGTDYYMELKASLAAWDPQLAGGSSKGRHLLSWMEYFLDAIDILSRHLESVEETPKKKPGRRSASSV